MIVWRHWSSVGWSLIILAVRPCSLRSVNMHAAWNSYVSSWIRRQRSMYRNLRKRSFQVREIGDLGGTHEFEKEGSERFDRVKLDFSRFTDWLSIILNSPFSSVLEPSSSISLLPLKHLRDLDIQTLHPLTEVDLINLLSASDSLARLKKLALPRNTTDEVIKSICTKASFARSLTHLNLNSCPSLSNRSVLYINKSFLALEELCLNDNVNINDFAFIGLSICGIGKSIEWLDHTLINRQFIDDLPIWTCSITHQSPCQCQLPVYLSSSCVKLRLKDFSFDNDEHSDQTLSMLIRHPLFREYFLSINQLRHLKSLKLRQCVQLTNRLFRFGFHHLPNLKSLDLCGCEKLTDTDLSLIGQSCRSLEMIDLTGCHRITDLGRQSLRDKAKRLKSLEFWKEISHSFAIFSRICFVFVQSK